MMDSQASILCKKILFISSFKPAHYLSVSHRKCYNLFPVLIA
jgi:hypothetical protein